MGQAQTAKAHRKVQKLALSSLIVASAWGTLGISAGLTADNTLSAPGRIEGGGDLLSLCTSATGTIAELRIKAGDHVQAGQHLVRIECGGIEREVEARKLDLAAAEAVLSRTLHGPRAEEITFGMANVNLAEARAQEA